MLLQVKFAQSGEDILFSLSLSIYIDGYEHEAIQDPISENNIGAPSAPQKGNGEIDERDY